MTCAAVHERAFPWGAAVAGTLTLNKLSVDSATVLTLGGHTVDEVLKYSALSAQINSEEAIDVVLIESYAGKDTMWNGLKQSKFVPFNPVDKYTIAHVTEDSTGKTYRLLKGAPQVRLLSLLAPKRARHMHG